MRTLILLAACMVGPAFAVEPSLPERCLHPKPPTVFGCSNAANLAATADRADLDHGRAPSPTPAMLDAAAIERLRTDKTKPLMGTGATDNFQPGNGPK